MCLVDSYDKSICGRSHTDHGPGSKENLVKMICSPASGEASLLGGVSHPEMFCVSVGGTTISGLLGLRTKSKSFGILLSILCHFSGHPKSKNNSKPR